MQNVVKYFCPDCHRLVTADFEDGRLYCSHCERSIRLPDESTPCAICEIPPNGNKTHWGYLVHIYLAKAYLREWTGNTLHDCFVNRKIAQCVLPICQNCLKKDRRARRREALLGGLASFAFLILFAYLGDIIKIGWISELFTLGAVACFLLLCYCVSKIPSFYDRSHVPFAPAIQERLEKHVGKDHIGHALSSDTYVLEIGNRIGVGKNETCNIKDRDYREIDWKNLAEWLDSPG